MSDASVWRSRSFRLVWGGGLVNDVGDWLLLVGLPVFVFTRSRSGPATAVLFVVGVGVAVVFGPIGGVLVDRWNLRHTLIATNVAQAVTLLPLLAVTSDRLWPAFAVIGVQALLTQVNNPAKVALLPRLVRPDQLVQANAANSLGASLARLIGSPAGGLAVAAGGLNAVVLIDGLSFLAVAVATLFVPPLPATGPALAAGHTPSGMRAGLQAIRRRRPLPALLTISAISQLAQGLFVVLFVAFVVTKLHDDGSRLGIIRGGMAIGGLAGAWVITRLAGRLAARTLLIFGFAGMGAVALLFWNAPALTTALWVYLVLFACSGLPGASLSIGLTTMAQQLSPPGALGRVIGVSQAADAAGQALGALAAGVLLAPVGLTMLLEVQATIYLLCALLTATVVRGDVAVGADRATPVTSDTR